MSKFTVKVRLPDGTEEIHACNTVTVVGGPNAAYSAETPPPQRDMYEEGIFLDREVQPRALGEPRFYTSSHIILFGGDETAERAARKGGKVWVMSESGATVAQYDL